MTTTNRIGLYIHIPFCIRKCRYCDFLSFSCDKEKPLKEYTQALIRELKIRAEQWPYRVVNSIFIGGGTPSLLPDGEIAKIMEAVNEAFAVDEDAEITIEVNPATVYDAKFAEYRNAGINRVSIGVQSFDSSILNLLGRAHNKNDALAAVRAAKKAGFEDVNIDIMFGIPNQTMKMLKDTVRQSIFLGPEHISLYSLQIEEGTPFYKMICEDKTLKATSEESDREMYHEVLRMLRDAGYKQYEISNVALPGHESRHNMKYWSYEEYLGVGLGASSFIGGVRFRNHSNMLKYIDAIKAFKDPANEEEMYKYTLREEMGIYMFTGLRKTEGIDFDEFEKVFDVGFFEVYDPEILRKYRDFLTVEGGRMALNEKGMDISNTIMSEFV